MPTENCSASEVPCNPMYFGKTDNNKFFCADKSSSEGIKDENQKVNTLVKQCSHLSSKVDMADWYNKNIGKDKAFTKDAWAKNRSAMQGFCWNYVHTVAKGKEWTTGACQKLAALDKQHEQLIDGVVEVETPVVPATPADSTPVIAPSTTVAQQTEPSECPGEEVTNPLSGKKVDQHTNISLNAGDSQFCQAHVDVKTGTDFPAGYYIVNALKNKETAHNVYTGIEVYHSKTPGGPFCLWKDTGDASEKRVLKNGEPKDQCDTPEFAFISGLKGGFKMKVSLDRDDSNLCGFSMVEDKKFKNPFKHRDIPTHTYLFRHQSEEQAFGNREALLKDATHQLKCPNATTKSLTEAMVAMMTSKTCVSSGMPALRMANLDDKDIEKKMRYSSDKIDIDKHLDATRPGRASFCISANQCNYIDWAGSEVREDGKPVATRTISDWDSTIVKLNGAEMPLSSVCTLMKTASVSPPSSGETKSHTGH